MTFCMKKGNKLDSTKFEMIKDIIINERNEIYEKL